MKLIEPKLLSREKFKELSFKRDKYTCVFCSNPATACHHIIERNLFSNGGYYLDNASSVCDSHHWECEKTNISVEKVRKACGIKAIILPENFDKNKVYDKWGNIILENGKRMPGPLFFKENVQKILKDKMYLFE